MVAKLLLVTVLFTTAVLARPNSDDGEQRKEMMKKFSSCAKENDVTFDVLTKNFSCEDVGCKNWANCFLQKIEVMKDENTINENYKVDPKYVEGQNKICYESCLREAQGVSEKDKTACTLIKCYKDNCHQKKEE